jgi:hypothetical protein
VYLENSTDHLVVQAIEARLVQNFLNLEDAQPTLARVVGFFLRRGFGI